MEVTILEAANAPVRSVLALQVGSVRRQAVLEKGLPIVLPNPGASSCKVDVTVMQQLGSLTLPGDAKPEAECSIAAKCADGSEEQVKLRVRFDNPSGSVASGASGSAKPGLAGLAADNAGVTKNYLDQHQLQNRIQGLIQDVLREQPDNPFRYMMEQLKQQHKQQKLQPEQQSDQQPQPQQQRTQQEQKPEEPPKAAEKPAVQVQANAQPRPPAEPRPEKARPSPVVRKEERAATGGQLSVPGAKKTGRSAVTAAVVKLVLNMPACVSVAEQSLRNQKVRESSRVMSRSILSSVRSAIVTEITDAATAKAPADVDKADQTNYPSSSVDTKTLTRWSINASFNGAAGLIGSDKDRRRSNFAEDELPRRSSLPTPIVSLCPETTNWGAMLGAR